MLLADGTDLYVRFMEGQLLVTRIVDNIWQTEDTYIIETGRELFQTAHMKIYLRRWLTWEDSEGVDSCDWQSAFDD